MSLGKRTLWVFGDSFSDIFRDWTTHDGSESSYIKYRKYRGGEYPKTWSEILSDAMSYNLKNISQGGLCNYGIFNNFIDNCDQIEFGDSVIIGWTFLHRFRMSCNDKFVSISFQDKDGQDYWGGQKVVEEIVYNRLEKPYAKEVYSFIKIIDELAKYKKFNVHYWSAEDKLINNEPYEYKNQPKFLLPECNRSMIDYLQIQHGAKTIGMETRMEIPDLHYGEDGHKVMARKFREDMLERRIQNYISNPDESFII
jgi:hypothetical protein